MVEDRNDLFLDSNYVHNTVESSKYAVIVMTMKCSIIRPTCMQEGNC